VSAAGRRVGQIAPTFVGSIAGTLAGDDPQPSRPRWTVACFMSGEQGKGSYRRTDRLIGTFSAVTGDICSYQYDAGHPIGTTTLNPIHAHAATGRGLSKWTKASQSRITSMGTV
jgi:hypothetical protein